MERSYYAIIPANVRYDKELTPNAKLLYGEITALTNEKGYCWATNNYFAELYDVSKVSISKWINQLADKGYINTEIIYKEGTKEILNRYITIIQYPVKENFNTPIKEKFKDNNTLINNTSNNTCNIYIPYQEIIDYLNSKANTNYRATGKKTKDLIKARINESFTLEDFKIVIDKKCNEWLGTDFENYLRPETLFSNKFEGYLNQKAVNYGNTKQNYNQQGQHGKSNGLAEGIGFNVDDLQ